MMLALGDWNGERPRRFSVGQMRHMNKDDLAVMVPPDGLEPPTR